jgi:sulfate adenylyltransferase
VSHVGPQFVPSDHALADLRLLLRGIELPLDVLGGTYLPRDHAMPAHGVARLRIPAELVERVTEAGAVVLADEENKPLATVTGVSVSPADGHGAVVEGGVEPVDPSLWTPLHLARDSAEPVSVVLATRPLLTADVEQIRSRTDRGSLVVAVPVAGPTPDGLPAPTLLRLVHAALGPEAAERSVDVVPVDLAWRDPETDAALAGAVVEALGAAEPTPLAAGEQDWGRLLDALDADRTLPAVADDVTLAELRRWLPPRSRRGVVVLFTGLSGSGKSTLARGLAAYISANTERTVSLLDGDEVRRLLSSGLGFDHASRDLNVRRIGFVAAEVARHGGIAICAPIAPYAESRAAVRAMAREVGGFVLVHVSTPLAEAERRDVKGLYARARAGLIEHFTGVNDPYDEPTDADVTIDTSVVSVADAVDSLVDFMQSRGWLPAVDGQD